MTNERITLSGGDGKPLEVEREDVPNDFAPTMPFPFIEEPADLPSPTVENIVGMSASGKVYVAADQYNAERILAREAALVERINQGLAREANYLEAFRQISAILAQVGAR